MSILSNSINQINTNLHGFHYIGYYQSSGNDTKTLTITPGLYLITWTQGGAWAPVVFLHYATGWQSTSQKIMGTSSHTTSNNTASQYLSTMTLSLKNPTAAGSGWDVYKIL